MLVAVLVFGPDKLPDLARQAGQMLRKARQFADSARDELREELGPEYADLELRDLDPRTIVRKHIIEAMNDAEDDAKPSGRALRAPSRHGEPRRTTSRRSGRRGEPRARPGPACEQGDVADRRSQGRGYR